jgi:hypothetical protein
MDKSPILRFESDESIKLADLVSIKQNLFFVEQVTERLLSLTSESNQDSVLLQSLWSAALVAYIRCFSSGKRFGLTKDIFLKTHGGEETHQYFKDVRDKHIAHSVNPFEEVQIGLVLSQPDQCVSSVACLSTFRLIDDTHNVKQLGQLAKYARQNIEGQVKEMEVKVLEQGKALSKAEINKLPQVRIQPQGGSDTAGKSRSK